MGAADLCLRLIKKINIYIYEILHVPLLEWSETTAGLYKTILLSEELNCRCSGQVIRTILAGPNKDILFRTITRGYGQLDTLYNG